VRCVLCCVVLLDTDKGGGGKGKGTCRNVVAVPRGRPAVRGINGHESGVVLGFYAKCVCLVSD
jgi:hypothetical protein